MLSRWAKLSSPDTGSGQTLDTLAATASRSGSQSTVSSATTSPDQAPSYQHPDPTVPAAVSAIKAHFLAQPKLQVDILGILQVTAERFEGARREMASQQGGEWDNDMWEVAARKINITRLKLERWADIVASIGGETLLGRRYDASSAGSSPDGNSERGGPSTEKMAHSGGCLDIHAQTLAHVPQAYIAQGTHGMPATPPYHTGWQPPPAFANNLFDDLGLDQSFFFDDPGDYGSILLNSMEPSNI